MTFSKKYIVYDLVVQIRNVYIEKTIQINNTSILKMIVSNLFVVQYIVFYSLDFCFVLFVVDLNIKNNSIFSIITNVLFVDFRNKDFIDNSTYCQYRDNS